MKNKEYPLYEVVPKISSIKDLLEQKNRNIPDNIAFRFRKGKNIVDKTYNDVYKEVQKASVVVLEKYGTGKHIAIIGENSYEWLIAYFAILMTGNVAVPTDKELPADEIEWLLNKADVNAVFISKTYRDLVENIEGMSYMTLTDLVNAEAENYENYEFYEPEPDELACIFFTSGTTGRSKGVMLSHYNIAYEINGCCSMFYPEGGNALVVLPFHHAFGLNVAVLMVFNYEMPIFLNKSLKKIKEDLQESKPSLMMLVPLFTETFYKQIMDTVKKTGKEKTFKKGLKISSILMKLGIDKRRKFFKDIIDVFGGELKYIISGGAYLDPRYVFAFRKFGIEILNGYGTTECSPCVSINRNYYKKDGSIGPVIDGTLVRANEEGEIQFKGPSTMLGYYKDQEATDEVLKDGWYSTGDLGYVDEDGFIFITGRKKNLIILSNGENISPEELENDLLKDPAVNEVMVYEENRKIVASIFPEEEFMGNTEYFDELINKVNKGRPVYKQIVSFTLREEEFIKNTTKKIVRYKNIPKQQG
ncbi:MAG: AMP-binding protein [Lachnospiraceae bacterium]|nr:AMP-binding protein [Lachnospiraceae bacterium]